MDCKEVDSHGSRHRRSGVIEPETKGCFNNPFLEFRAQRVRHELIYKGSAVCPFVTKPFLLNHFLHLRLIFITI